MESDNTTPKNTLSPLREIVHAQKQGIPKGIYSICSANQFVLEAGFQQALRDQKTLRDQKMVQDNSILLIESTSNQVNQYRGYTGMTPNMFATYVHDLAALYKLPENQIIMGGDHLGPHVWQDEPAVSAMAKARQLVRDCVLAGFTKIHLDASMKCADDPPDAALSVTTSAKRAAELCQAAEDAYTMLHPGRTKPCYVIGTEVPIPGGTLEQEDEISVTAVEDVRETIEVTRRAFFKLGLEETWERVIAVVVQPGVEYGDETLFEYNQSLAAPLRKFIETYDHLVYEAHSTDYQTRDALKRLVEDHFAILKVGPALTFAFREAVYALSWIEEELLARESSAGASSLKQVLDNSMLANPVYWKKYYSGNESELRFARKYSFSDRSRYYWPVTDVQQALSKLFENLGRIPVPLTLLSQHLPIQYNKVRSGELANSPKAWVYDKITSVLSDYAFACGYG
jgi:D-tagatose-1,6-bisphosphate aldolase subunit GatZ/KbaZ